MKSESGERPRGASDRLAAQFWVSWENTMPSGIVRKSYGTVPGDRQREMTGLEFVHGLVDGTLPLNTIARTLGYDITKVESGRVEITAEPNGTHLNPAGTVHGGFSATLLDSCMGLAVLSTLEKVSAKPPSNLRFHSSGPSPPRPAQLPQKALC